MKEAKKQPNVATIHPMNINATQNTNTMDMCLLKIETKTTSNVLLFLKNASCARDDQHAYTSLPFLSFSLSFEFSCV